MWNKKLANSHVVQLLLQIFFCFRIHSIYSLFFKNFFFWARRWWGGNSLLSPESWWWSWGGTRLMAKDHPLQLPRTEIIQLFVPHRKRRGKIKIVWQSERKKNRKKCPKNSILTTILLRTYGLYRWIYKPHGRGRGYVLFAASSYLRT